MVVAVSSVAVDIQGIIFFQAFDFILYFASESFANYIRIFLQNEN